MQADGVYPRRCIPVHCGFYASGRTVIHKGELGMLELSGRGMVTCTDGVAWVTYPGRFCDYLIREGESLILKGDGKVVISGGTKSVGIRVRRW